MISIRYAPVKPASRPAAVSSPPGAASDPRDSLMMTVPTVTPNPRPASAAHTSTTGAEARDLAGARARMRIVRRPLGRGGRRVAHHEATLTHQAQGIVTTSCGFLLSRDPAADRPAEASRIRLARGWPGRRYESCAGCK